MNFSLLTNHVYNNQALGAEECSLEGLSYRSVTGKFSGSVPAYPSYYLSGASAPGILGGLRGAYQISRLG